MTSRLWTSPCLPVQVSHAPLASLTFSPLFPDLRPFASEGGHLQEKFGPTAES